MIRRAPRSTLFPCTTLGRAKPEAEQSFIRILLVEDDEDDFVLTRDALRSISKGRMVLEWVDNGEQADRKSTRLNSSHANISYAVFCLITTTLPSPSFLLYSS